MRFHDLTRAAVFAVFWLCALPAAGQSAMAEPGLRGELVFRADHFSQRADSQGAAVIARLNGETPAFGGHATARVALSRSWLDSRSHDQALLRELVWMRRFDHWQFSAGRLMPVHSRADGFRVLDVLTPVDWPDAFFETTEHSRLGLWSAHLEHETDKHGLSVWWSGDRRLDRFTPPGADLPDPPAKASSFGRNSLALKWNVRAANADLTALAYRGLWRQAQPVLTQLGVDWQARRVSMLGGSFDLPVGTLVLRGEAARMRYDSGSPDYGLPQAHALLGLDWLRGSVLFSPQVFSEYGTRQLGEEKRWRHSLSMLVDARMLQDRLGLRYFAVWSDQGDGRWQSLHLTWTTVSHRQWRLKIDRLSGSGGNALGVFGDRSRASLEWVVPF